MKEVADKITKELKALIEMIKDNQHYGEWISHEDEYRERKRRVVNTMLFLREELKPFGFEILNLASELV